MSGETIAALGLGSLFALAVNAVFEAISVRARRRMWRRIRERDGIDELALQETIYDLVNEDRLTVADAAYLLTRAEVPSEDEEASS